MDRIEYSSVSSESVASFDTILTAVDPREDHLAEIILNMPTGRFVSPTGIDEF